MNCFHWVHAKFEVKILTSEENLSSIVGGRISPLAKPLIWAYISAPDLPREAKPQQFLPYDTI